MHQNEMLSWAILLVHVFLLLGIDIFILHRKNRTPSVKKVLFETLFFVSNALLFSGVIYWMYKDGIAANIDNLSPTESVVKYLTGYLIELSLSVDNLFVIAIIFVRYKIPPQYQHRLLFLGILGAIIFRGLLIALGLVLIHKIHGINIVFGLFLLYTAFKMMKGEKEESSPKDNTGILSFFNISNVLDNGNFVTEIDGKKVFTVLFAALIVIEFTDLLFALDSIPAIFAITTDPYLVFSSNIFAIMGLRSLYFLLSNMLDKFHYLKYSVFLILIFVAIKLIVANWIKIPEWFSLSFILLSLTVGILVSIINMKSANRDS